MQLDLLLLGNQLGCLLGCVCQLLLPIRAAWWHLMHMCLESKLCFKLLAALLLLLLQHGQPLLFVAVSELLHSCNLAQCIFCCVLLLFTHRPPDDRSCTLCWPMQMQCLGAKGLHCGVFCSSDKANCIVAK